MNIYKYCHERDKTLSDIAREIDITPRYLYRILSGQLKLTGKVQRALERISDGKITAKMIERSRTVCRCCGRPL